MGAANLGTETTWTKVQEEDCIMVLVPKPAEHSAYGFVHRL